MAEAEFTARRVRIGKRLQSLTTAGEVRIADGRVELLTSNGREIDSAPVQAVRAGKPWFASGGRALASLGGRRYTLTLDSEDPEPAPDRDSGQQRAARRFIDAVQRASGRRT